MPRSTSALVAVAPEIEDALARRAAVVALETTLVAHGFPEREGIAVGLEAERRVRERGAVPATIGVLDGAVRVGLEARELEHFRPDARKVGPRDLAPCAVQSAVGATTVAATLAVCRVAGIRFMGTGGLGGVHRGWAATLDVSADLGELARTQAVVVCSGVKSLLDVAATAELLETLGVPVLGFRTDRLPLFYPEGGPTVPPRVETAGQAARVARVHWELERSSALVVARPPDEPLDIEPLIEQALAAAAAEGVTGQPLTPFVLAHLHRESGGRTLEANRQLVTDNAALAADVAVAYAALER